MIYYINVYEDNKLGMCWPDKLSAEVHSSDYRKVLYMIKVTMK